MLACAASIAVLAGCDTGAPSAHPPPPGVRLEGVQFRAWREGALSASGTAARATYRKDTGAVVAEDARVTIPRPGTPDILVSAPRVEGTPGSRAWTARGGVVLTRGDATARTPSARWSGEDGQVRGDEPVVVTGPGYRLEGPSFTADPGTGDVEIRDGVRLVAGGEAR